MIDSTDRQDVRVRAARHADDDGAERGFILVMFGLLLLPIVVFTALAIDVSSWYSRATELQRSADAASLAGVVWMPDLTKAQSVAKPILTNNGVPTDGSSDMTVAMTTGQGGSTSFRVCVTDNKVTQFFGAVFASPTKLTRCATAQYQTPLQLGSPLNYFGGNHADLQVPGPVPADASVPTPPYSDFGSGASRDNYCWVNNSTGVTVGYWYRANSATATDWKFWPYPANALSGAHPVCSTPAPALPNEPANNQSCEVPGTNSYWYKENSGYTFPRGWRYRNNPGFNYPDCTYGAPVSPIPSEKSPNFWAAVEGYNNAHGNGDAYSTKGDEYRDTGYWYSVDIPDSGVNGNVSIQAWDGATNCELGCRTPMGDDGGPSTRFRVYRAGALKFDMSAITPASCSTGSNDSGYVSSNTNWNLRWKVLCTVSASPGERYYVQVQSSDSSNASKTGSGYNGYAMRAVAGTFPSACLDKMPVGNVACYEGSPKVTQPRLSAYGDMEMYNGIGAGTPTRFYLADVTPEYASKKLAIDLFDPGDGAGSSWVTVMGPSTSTTTGTMIPSSACTVKYRAYGSSTWNNVTLSSGPSNAYPNTCTVQTTTSSSNKYQDRWLRFEIDLPANYGPSGTASWTKCDTDVEDPVHDPGSCWWQIQYYVGGSAPLSDYTTWSAKIIGDPVRLTQ